MPVRAEFWCVTINRCEVTVISIGLVSRSDPTVCRLDLTFRTRHDSALIAFSTACRTKNCCTKIADDQ